MSQSISSSISSIKSIDKPLDKIVKYGIKLAKHQRCSYNYHFNAIIIVVIQEN